MGIRDFFKRLFGKNNLALPEAQNRPYTESQSLNFYTNDGDYVLIDGIKNENIEIQNSKGSTILYSAIILKGNDTCQPKKICFEIPRDCNVQKMQTQIQNLISTVYNNKQTIRDYGYDGTFTHIGVINNDGYGGYVLNSPKMVAKQWIEQNLNQPIRQKNIYYNEQYKEQQKRIELRRRVENDYIAHKNKLEIENDIFNQKADRWDKPIFEVDRFNKNSYTLYQQPDLNDKYQRSGYSNLRNVQCIGTLSHRDGRVGYAYCADLNNYTDADIGGANLLNPVYPKVCFELPCSIEEMQIKFQNGDKSVVQYLGIILSQKNLNEKRLQRSNGERIYMGAVKEFKGALSFDYNNQPAIEKYIAEEQVQINNMRPNNNNKQGPNCDGR